MLLSSPDDDDAAEQSPLPTSRSSARRTTVMPNPSPVKLARPQRTASATKRALLQQGAAALHDDEAQEVLNYIQLPPSRVTRRMLAGLSESGQRMYEQLRQDEQRAATRGRDVASPLPTSHQSPQVSFSVGEPAHSSVRLPHFVAAQPPPVWLPDARAAGDTSRRVRAAVQDAYNSVDGTVPVAHDSEEETKEPHFVPTARLRAMLKRHGVPDGVLSEVDALEIARGEIGGSSFEQWWQARAPNMRRERQTSQYYEGLVLSLMLDNIDRPDVWVQIAARRWCVLNGNVTHNLTWDMARAFLPLSSAGAFSTSLVYDMQKFVKSQKEMRTVLYPNAERNSSSTYNNGSSGSGGGGKRRGKGERGDDSKHGSGKESETQSGSRKGRKGRRNNSGGAGASSASGAEQE